MAAGASEAVEATDAGARDQTVVSPAQGECAGQPTADPLCNPPQVLVLSPEPVIPLILPVAAPVPKCLAHAPAPRSTANANPCEGTGGGGTG